MKKAKVHARDAATPLAGGGFVALCGARARYRKPLIATKATEITCKTCLGWPSLVKEAYRYEEHEVRR